MQVKDYNSCLHELESKNKRFSEKWPVLRSVVGPILEFLRTFDTAVSTCCQSNADIACLVWGSVQIVLTVSLISILLFASIYNASKLTEPMIRSQPSIRTAQNGSQTC